MIEASILVAITLLLTCGGLLLWRARGGPGTGLLAWSLRAAGLSLALGLLVVPSAWAYSKLPSHQLMGRLIHRVDTGSNPVVALTLDDGPTAAYTTEVLDILRQEDVPATFFVVGKALERHPELCQQILDAGHELGNHSYSHPRLIFKPYGKIQDEIERTDTLIRDCGQEGAIHFRPPTGKKLVLLPYYLRQTGRTSITWDVAPEYQVGQASGPLDAETLVQRVLDETQPGSIILMHVMYKGRESSREALPHIIQGLKERGYRFVTVSELLEIEQH